MKYQVTKLNVINQEHYDIIKDKCFTELSEIPLTTHYVLDTETCRTKGEMLLDTNMEQEVKTYAVGVMSVGDKDNNMFVCETWEMFFENIYKTVQANLNFYLKNNQKRNKKNLDITIKIGVHNVKYENSFMQYVLNNLGYVYSAGVIAYNDKKGCSFNKVMLDTGCYNITQANGVHYGAKVCLKDTIINQKIISKGKNKGKIVDQEIKIYLEFWDTLKVAQTSLEKAHKFVEMNEMYYKLNKEYDYDMVRDNGHILDALELEYLYNDLYATKKLVEDFYYDTLLTFQGKDKTIYLNDNLKTSASIAFNTAIAYTFSNGESEITNIKEARENFNEHFEIDKRIELKQEIKDMERLSYRGGWTHANLKHINKIVEKQGVSIDKNSSYPAQMCYGLLPYGAPIEFNSVEDMKKYMNENELTMDDHVFIINTGFDYVRPKCDKYDLEVIQLGSVNATMEFKKMTFEHEGKVVQNGNTFINRNYWDEDNKIQIYKKGCEEIANYNFTITNVEYDFLNKYFEFGYHEEIDFIDNEITFEGLRTGKVLLYKAERGILREYIEELYLMKDEVKRRINKGEKGLDALYSSIKVLLNSLYGKFGSKVRKTLDNLFLNDDGIFSWDIGCKKELRENGNEIDLLEYDSEEYYVPFASFVTANARVEIQTMVIEAIGVKNFLYTDTDSIYCSLTKKQLIEALKKINYELDGYELGKWDLEHEFDKFKSLGAKKYMIHDTNSNKLCVACAGVPKKAQSILAKQGFNEFYLGKAIEGKLQSKQVKGGTLLTNIDFVIQSTIYVPH